MWIKSGETLLNLDRVDYLDIMVAQPASKGLKCLYANWRVENPEAEPEETFRCICTDKAEIIEKLFDHLSECMRQDRTMLDIDKWLANARYEAQKKAEADAERAKYAGGTIDYAQMVQMIVEKAREHAHDDD